MQNKFLWTFWHKVNARKALRKKLISKREKERNEQKKKNKECIWDSLIIKIDPVMLLLRPPKVHV